MSAHDQLVALYEQLADVRATIEGAKAHARSALGVAEYESRWSAIDILRDEERTILDEIESLGGEDPEL